MKLLCRLFGHKWIRKDSNPSEVILTGAYRETCTRCGKWKEFDADDNFLLDGQD